MSFCGKIIKNLSGKRDSDPRPQPWQGCALPTELFPQQINIFLKVKRRRLELPRHNCHYPLKVARLPIPPPLQLFKNILNKNVPRTGLEPARRETHAPETCASTNSATWAFWSKQCASWVIQNVWAENGTRTRDPNLGKVVLYQLSYFRDISYF